MIIRISEWRQTLNNDLICHPSNYPEVQHKYNDTNLGETFDLSDPEMY